MIRVTEVKIQNQTVDFLWTFQSRSDREREWETRDWSRAVLAFHQPYSLHSQSDNCVMIPLTPRRRRTCWIPTLDAAHISFWQDLTSVPGLHRLNYQFSTHLPAGLRGWNIPFIRRYFSLTAQISKRQMHLAMPGSFSLLIIELQTGLKRFILGSFKVFAAFVLFILRFKFLQKFKSNEKKECNRVLHYSRDPQSVYSLFVLTLSWRQRTITGGGGQETWVEPTWVFTSRVISDSFWG